ncbi:MAG TPA: tripartite tricarboxylate transporter substrate binding protein [Burkholderiales bacterium]|nr:tripartite tricarboxylate transporter substrate binding protein [Burkholderiales bacterium]
MRRILAALALICTAASAQDYPSRPVHLVVPYTPGTGADLLARILSVKLGERWKAPVVVDNRPGATGNIGTDLVAKSAADGYTLLLAATSFSTNPSLTAPLPYDPVKSFAPVVLVATSTLAVVMNPEMPAQTFAEFLDLVKRQPGKLYYGSPGNGGIQHLAMELLKLETGMNLVHVPYKGLGGAMSDVIAGHIPVMISATQSAAPHVRSGKLRMLVLMSAERQAAFPGVPTLHELGYRDLDVDTWYALFAPAGAPPGVVARVNADVNLFLKDAETRELLAKQGLNPGGGTPAQLGAMVERELARWSRVVSAAGIKAD